VGFYIPIAVLGWLTVRNRPWAPWWGLVHSTTCMLASVALLLGMKLDAGGAFEDLEPATGIAFYSLFVALSLLLVFGYAIALVAQSSMRHGQR
jgi:hypothetical protein